jgi:hypothetical protein
MQAQQHIMANATGANSSPVELAMIFVSLLFMCIRFKSGLYYTLTEK